MLQTSVIKADSSAPSAGSKDKDVPTSTPHVDFSAYFSQMVAALPALPEDLTPTPSPPAPATVRIQPSAPSRAGGTPASAPAAGAAQPAASQASTPTQAQAAPPASSQGSSQGSSPSSSQASSPSSSQASSPSSSQASSPSSSQASSPSSSQASSPSSSQASSQGPPQAAPSGGTGPAQAQSAPRAGDPSAPADPRPAPASTPAPQADLPAPTAAAADPQADAKAKAALDQAYPGGKFQVQVDADPDPPTTAQASLTDLVDPVAQAATAPQAASQDQSAGPQPVPAQATATAAALADLSSAAALQAPLLAAQTAILGATALPAAPVPNPDSATADNVAATSAASAQAAGAGALPGASGAVRVTAASSPESSLATRQDSLFSQVDGSIRWLLKNQDQGAELQLHPESLGRVQIKLQVEGTVVHAKLWATEASAVPVLQQHRASLETSLQAQGLTLGSFDLQHGRREGQTPLPTQDPAATAAVGSALESSGTGQETPTLPSPSVSRPGRIEIVA